MLQTLSITNVVLIDQLNLEFKTGFGALTGETGAGKSILLDALGLALGERSNTNLIRPKEDQATVTAEFLVSETHPVHKLLNEQGLSAGDTIILRRILTRDGRSRAFVNDQTVSLNLLKTIGEILVEIHGQFDHLLNATSHQDVLDSFGSLEILNVQTKEAFKTYKAAKQSHQNTQEKAAKQLKNQEYLQYCLKELKELNFQENEEEILLQKRIKFQNSEKLKDIYKSSLEALSHERGAESLLLQAYKNVHKANEITHGTFDKILIVLDRALIETSEALRQLQTSFSLDIQGNETLESIEDRLYHLRSVARKHDVNIADLFAVKSKIENDLMFIQDSEETLRHLDEILENTRLVFRKNAEELSKARKNAALKLEHALSEELPPLKLENARLKVLFSELEEDNWNESGYDHVQFTVSTNPGMPFGPLTKIASGGERSRLMLALKVLLANNTQNSLLIFDEIDAGVGGAVASAIGQRLKKLSHQLQVLAITHSPQVASYAHYHMHAYKRSHLEEFQTKVYVLDDNERREEIARMLAGASVTDEARAAAEQLLKTGTHL
ncbi:MAG: DNA repair protein RecN [Candidatus Paracaedimonas acanthamoebae]|uniref:DNA repair protein RecN n=1 Tax=Candidatus Paracaedimonas acanthamoebae TaxID=244581 RepID=A0A8J7TVV8_9PROT|nr:DNA repair protein RecN [Candidatus Paracaedimonas acanthamoebae]